MKTYCSSWVLCFSLLSLAGTARAHNGTLRGIITDYITRIAVDSVLVSMPDDHLSTWTSQAGEFIFEGIPARKYKISVSKPGYQSKEATVNVEEDQVTIFSMDLMPAVIDLPGLTVTATWPVSAASSQSLQVIDFELRPKNSAQDMLRLVPGLFIAQHAGGGKAEQIFVRGFDCDHGTDVASYVDGVPVNMPSHGHGQGYADLHFLIPEVVRKIEVTKGPYFPENGDFATAAAVRFQTFDELDRNEIKVEAVSAPSQRALSASRTLFLMRLPVQSNRLGSYFAADFQYAPGYFDASQQFLRFAVFSKTRFEINDQTSLTASIGGFGSSWDASGQVPARAVASGTIDRFGSIDPREGGNTTRNNVNLELHSRAGGNELYSQFFASGYRFRLYSDFTFYQNDPQNGDMIEQTDDRFLMGYNGSFSLPGHIGSMEIRTTLGGGFRSDRIENSMWHAPDRHRMEVTAQALVFERSMYGMIKEEFFITSRLKAEVGLRTDYFTFDVEDLIPADSSHDNYSGTNYQVLASPKINLIYTPAPNIHFFLNTGTGFHSNDARSVVQDPGNHRLPLAVGGEAGMQMRFGPVIFSAALWQLDLENELVYVGDDGTTENKGASRRRGLDFSVRYQVTDWLFADADINGSQNVLLEDFLGSERSEENHVPLAPVLTSTSGITVLHPKGWEGLLRYRYMADRPANESYTVVAEGYAVLDLGAACHTKQWRVGLSIENLLNTEWNEAQFDTESRLFDEPEPVDELHFTPGSPRAVKGSFSVFF